MVQDQGPVQSTFPKLSYRNLLKALARKRTRAVVNPFQPKPKIPQDTVVTVYRYNAQKVEVEHPKNIEEYLNMNKNVQEYQWINMDHLNSEEMEKVCRFFQIHWLIQEDILSVGQRPKVDELDGVLYVLLNLVYYDDAVGMIEQEQISLVLGEKFVLSFQEDSSRDVFDPIRAKMQIADSRERQRPPDFLFYSLLDMVVDSYLTVIEKIGAEIECTEEQLMHRTSPALFQKIAQLRKDIILLKRYVAPVRDLVGTLIRSHTPVLKKGTIRYLKDVYDHVSLANDLIDNYRDMNTTLQDMYVNSVNLRMNEVMKTLAIITAIMAPATVIGGIFGMNFQHIPFSDHPYGFLITIAVMVLIPFFMILWFYMRGWFHKDLPGK